jgi:hypothetical protein
VVTRATAINDAGFIAGDGFLNEFPQAFVLLPTTTRPISVYDATGLWHHSVTINGQIVDEADAFLTQDADGNITHCGECEGELWTFTRLSTTPERIRYGVALIAPDDAPCGGGIVASGSAELNTATHTITGTLTGAGADENNCAARFVASLALTRISP